MTERTLLKSCAMPAANWPTASIFWACRNWASSPRRSVTSVSTATVCVNFPSAPRTGEVATLVQNERPSLR